MQTYTLGGGYVVGVAYGAHLCMSYMEQSLDLDIKLMIVRVADFDPLF